MMNSKPLLSGQINDDGGIDLQAYSSKVFTRFQMFQVTDANGTKVD